MKPSIRRSPYWMDDMVCSMVGMPALAVVRGRERAPGWCSGVFEFKGYVVG